MAVALSMSVTLKNIFFDKKMPNVKFPGTTSSGISRQRKYQLRMLWDKSCTDCGAPGQ